MMHGPQTVNVNADMEKRSCKQTAEMETSQGHGPAPSQSHRCMTRNTHPTISQSTSSSSAFVFSLVRFHLPCCTWTESLRSMLYLLPGYL